MGHVQIWDATETDEPIPLLKRSKVTGERLLVARVHLAKGCVVPVHQHDSEQVAVLISGRVRWTLGHDGVEEEATAGSVLVLPGGFPHGLVVLEDAVAIDILSPIGPMGVDAVADLPD